MKLMSDAPEPKTLLEALADINQLKGERDAYQRENSGLHEWAHKDRETIAGYRKMFAELRAQCDTLKSKNAQLSEAVAALLAYRDANTLNFQLEKLDDYLRKLRELIEQQP